MHEALLRPDLPFPVHHGKVRDVYDLRENLLTVAPDRISAFDVVMPNGIPEKGKILTQLSVFWFEMFAGKFEHHLIAARMMAFPTSVPRAHALAGRSMLVRKSKVIPVECVARGYLAG